MQIIIKNAQKEVRLDEKKIRLTARKALRALKLPEDTILSLNFVTRYMIKKENTRYFGRERITDVIALGYDSLIPDEIYKGYMGEVIICPYAARINAKRFGSSFFKELTLYIIHGVLHLLGFGDLSSKDRRRMQKEQQRIMGMVWKDRQRKV